ncbi:hypothetical protein GQX74_014983 [Glossina fuscipes]|nr:hypothetical protein GQX74_014983 [Glossina fuscipes]
MSQRRAEFKIISVDTFAFLVGKISESGNEARALASFSSERFKIATTVRTRKLFTIYSNHRKKLPKTVKPNNIAGTMMVRKARERLPVPVAARYSSSVLEIYLLVDFPISPINNEAPNEDQPRHAYRDAVDPGIVYTHQM